MGIKSPSERRTTYGGEDCFILPAQHRLCRFMLELATANTLKRLSCPDGSVWMKCNEVAKLPGMKRDKFDRSAQFSGLYYMGLIECNSALDYAKGLWDTQQIRISDKGLDAVKLLKAGEPGLIIFLSSSRTRAATLIDVLG